MADETSNKILVALLIAGIAVLLGGTIISVNKITSVVKSPSIVSGYVSTSTATGTTNVTITSSAAIQFAIGNLDFGSGSVNTSGGNQDCSLASGKGGGSRDTNAKCINFTGAGSLESLQIENYGTTNLTVNLSSDKAAATFIGGPGGLEKFRFLVLNNETGACATPIPSSWTNVATTSTAICTSTGGLDYETTKNSLTLNINLTIPYDTYYAGLTNQVATLTATGTSLS